MEKTIIINVQHYLPGLTDVLCGLSDVTVDAEQMVELVLRSYPNLKFPKWPQENDIADREVLDNVYNSLSNDLFQVLSSMGIRHPLEFAQVKNGIAFLVLGN